MNASRETTTTTREEKLQASPALAFDRPQDVLTANDLSTDEKRAVLMRWKEDAIALQVATDENMSGGERPRLDEVVAALNALEGQ
jgi:hypothetical protein